jgi:hypothetical protein
VEAPQLSQPVTSEPVQVKGDEDRVDPPLTDARQQFIGTQISLDDEDD